MEFVADISSVIQSGITQPKSDIQLRVKNCRYATKIRMALSEYKQLQHSHNNY